MIWPTQGINIASSLSVSKEHVPTKFGVIVQLQSSEPVPMLQTMRSVRKDVVLRDHISHAQVHRASNGVIVIYIESTVGVVMDCVVPDLELQGC